MDNVLMGFLVGDRVEARDAGGNWHEAIVVPVPVEWRDSTTCVHWTSKGAFSKVWLGFASGDVIPWPLTAVRRGRVRRAPSGIDHFANDVKRFGFKWPAGEG